MKIGIDTRIPVKNLTGMGYMTQNLVRELLPIAKAKGDSVFMYGDRLDIDYSGVIFIRFSGLLKRALNFIWRYIKIIPVNIFDGRFDAFVFPNYVDFPVIADNKIIIVGDLSYMHYPEFLESKNRLFLSRSLPGAIKRADHIIAISDSIKREIIREFRVDSTKVTTMYLSDNNINRSGQQETLRVANKYGIRSEYILSVGTIEERKNYEFLLRAFALMGRDSKVDLVLVIAGNKTKYFEDIAILVNDLGIGDRVIFTGYIDEGDVSALYSGAIFCVFPSFYEGFGMPLVEAMRCGTPLLASDIAVFREVAQEAALYFDLGNIESLVDLMKYILIHSEVRDQMQEKGYLRVSNFSWRKSAEILYGILSKRS